MFLKNLKKACLIFLLTLIIIPTYVYAYSDYIIVGGENIGIELNSKGIMVAGMYKVNNTYPAKEAGLRVGDIILSINGHKVSSINELIERIDKSASNGTVRIGYSRNNQQMFTTLSLFKDQNNVYKTGLYVKDTVTGIGTLSFIDPKTKIFGALGHEIIEKTTGKILEIKDGKIFDSSVTSIERSENGNPGEKNAKFYSNNIKGKVNKNTSRGIFGQYLAELPNKKIYKVAQPSDVRLGEAKLLTVLKEKEVKEYDIEIIRINNNFNQKTKNFLFQIIDKELLETTGGVVQGMSGSPIIQDEYIIGAITHVVIDDPTKGYGIFITNMLEEAER
ncbi:MAG: SpoIVB peptidase [Mollicutes bacterium]|jgi:stage IV sporulation protein B|nr:SpoIVB peptidase [Mollicutes bacterium]